MCLCNVETFIEIASAMSDVQLQFTVFNQNNPFSVTGAYLGNLARVD